jgi:hypothetical protein
MSQLRFLHHSLLILKKSERAHFIRFLHYASEKNSKQFESICEKLAKAPANATPTERELEMDDPGFYRKLYDLRRLLQRFIIQELLPEEPHTHLIVQLQYLKYLREHQLHEEYMDTLGEIFSKLDPSRTKEPLRGVLTDFLNELRKFFYHKYYKEKNYKPVSITENYQLLHSAKQLMLLQHKQESVFFDFTLKAAHKIEADTLQKESPEAFTPQCYNTQEYLTLLEDDTLPLLHKTLILDILDRAPTVEAADYLLRIERLLDKHYNAATLQEQYNLLVCLIVSDHVPPTQKGVYYRQLVDLKPTLNPGVLHSYIVEHLASDPSQARIEFERLKAKAVNDSENDLRAIEGLLLTREQKYSEALRKLNQVTLYQQDKAYFEVNLGLLEAYLALEDLDIAASILQKLTVYYYKYKDSLPEATELKYRNEIARYKKILL